MFRPMTEGAPDWYWRVKHLLSLAFGLLGLAAFGILVATGFAPLTGELAALLAAAVVLFCFSAVRLLRG